MPHVRDADAFDPEEASSPIWGAATRSGDVAIRSDLDAKLPRMPAILSRGAAIRRWVGQYLRWRSRPNGRCSRFARRSFNPAPATPRSDFSLTRSDHGVGRSHHRSPRSPVAPPRLSLGKARSDSGNTRSTRPPSLPLRGRRVRRVPFRGQTAARDLSEETTAKQAGIETARHSAKAETRRARSRHGEHGGLRIQPDFSPSEHVFVQLHTDRVRLALTSRLNGVLLTKKVPARS